MTSFKGFSSFLGIKAGHPKSTGRRVSPFKPKEGLTKFPRYCERPHCSKTYFTGKKIENYNILSLLYESNRLHFLSTYQHDR